MKANELRKRVRTAPFEPIELGISDGRSVLVRHPDQIVVANRHVIIGLAQISRGRVRLSTPKSDVVAKDWLLLGLIHVVSAEPVDGKPMSTRRKKRK